MTTPYPFTAIVGQEDLKLALLLNTVSPSIGGVLVRGEKGTAKSTAVRGLQRLLPVIRTVGGCRFNCDPSSPACPDAPHATGEARRQVPLVELPVGSSSDRVTGSLDVEDALTTGRTTFRPGLLAAAHRGILYVDEVNLLADALVDLLLDAAALGVNYVERDGVSVRHASRFLLVGTMNPEEGELRPQLLDRFGITVHVSASADPAERAEVVRRRLAFEHDPDAFAGAWSAADQAVTERIVGARSLVGDVSLPDALLERIAGACASLGVDGMRADIVTARTAIALAAWHGRSEVCIEDVARALELAIPHRRRRGPFDQSDFDQPEIERALAAPAPSEDEPAAEDEPPPDVEPPPDDDPPRGARATAPQRVDAPAPTFRPVTLETRRTGPAGARHAAPDTRGAPVGDTRPRGRVADLSLTATLRAAAPHQVARGRTEGALVLRRADLRETVRHGRAGALVVFVLDASGSMGARRRMATTKAAVLSLLLDAYRRRDRVAVVAFRGGEASVVCEPTSSVEVGAARLATLPTGGRSPLAAGLDRARLVVRTERLRDPRRPAIAVILTDGRANAGGDPAAALAALAREAACLVVDTEAGPVRIGLAARLADGAGVPSLRPEQLEGSLRLVLDGVA